MSCTTVTLCVKEKNGRYRAATDQEIRSSACSLIEQELKSTTLLSNPASVRRYLALQLDNKEHEAFSVLYLNSQNKLIAFEELFRGTIDGTAVYPREVLKQVLKHHAASVIFSPNHPSGSSEASQADHRITERLRKALELIDVRVLDHIIVAPGGSYQSIAERGWL